MLDPKHIEAFKELIPPNRIKEDQETCSIYGKDWTSYEGIASIVLFPRSTEEVSKIVSYCFLHSLSLVPSGGRTGLAGGAVAHTNQIVLSLDKMNRILEIDTVGKTIEVEAGVITQNVQEEALNHGLFFPIDLAAKGSSQIGGNIATNAGGLKFIKYGGMRENVLGLEVVLSNGKVLDLNFNLMKNNSGYSLKHLFIGSEGTLGIITKATLALKIKPLDHSLLLMTVDQIDQIPKLLALCHKNRINPSAFEFFTKRALELVLKFNSSLKSPLEKKENYYLLLEVEKENQSEDLAIERFLEEAFKNNLISDGILSTNSKEYSQLWSYRELISEAIQLNGHVKKNDVSVPIKFLSSFVIALEKIEKSAPKELEIVLFGHIGDGNIHINYTANTNRVSSENFLSSLKKVESEVFAVLKRLKGSISAEHCIGLLKKDILKITSSQLEIDIQKTIKKIFDEKNILNPGKIFD